MYTLAQLAVSLSASCFIVGLLIWIFKSDTSTKRSMRGSSSTSADDWEVDDLRGKSKKA